MQTVWWVGLFCMCLCLRGASLLLLSRDMHGLTPPTPHPPDGKISYEKLQHQTIQSVLTPEA